MVAVELDDSGNTQFNSIQFAFDSIRFTGALLICYVAHRPLV